MSASGGAVRGALYTGRAPAPATGAVRFSRTTAESGSSTAGESPSPRSTSAVCRGGAWEIRTVGAIRTRFSEAAAASPASSTSAASSSLWMKLPAAPTRSFPCRCGSVLDEVLQRLRNGGGRVPSEEVQDGGGVLSRVQGPPDGLHGEPVDGGRTLPFGVCHPLQLLAQFRSSDTPAQQR